MMAPMISVLLPARNCEKYLSKSIESVLSQGFGDFELVVIYDDSSDSTLSLIESYARSDSRVRLVRGRGRGLADALACGVNVSLGVYIARVDADDYCLPGRFEHQQHLLNESGADVASCGCLNIDGSGKIIETSPPPSDMAQIHSRLFMGASPFTHGTAMIRRSFLVEKDLNYGGANFKLVEDMDLWCRMFIAGARFVSVDQFLYVYRAHADSLMSIKADQIELERKAIFNHYLPKIMDGIESDLDILFTEKTLRDPMVVGVAAFIYAIKARRWLWLKRKAKHFDGLTLVQSALIAWKTLRK